MNLYNRIKNKPALVSVIIVALMIFSFGVGSVWSSGENNDLRIRHLAYSPEAKKIANNSALDFDLYWEVWHRLKQDHIDKNKVSDEEMFYGSLRGLVRSMNDPYTIFMDPEESIEFTTDMSGSFEGIGAEVGMKDDIITIIAPLAGMPAEKAGIKAGDRVYAIDGLNTLGMSVDEAVKKIRGIKDTEVILTVIRDEEDKPLDISITRGIIVVKSIKTEMRDDGIMILTINSFNDDTEALFVSAIQEILLKNPKGIILDLRNNPGGYLDTAVTVASAWIPEGPVVVEQFGEGVREEYFAIGGAPLKNFKTIVLINGGSASASEIVAGALRDYNKAILLGQKSFGKGSVQSFKDLSDGSALKITVAQWLTPEGDYINDKGIIPEIEVEITREDIDHDRDPQLLKAINLLLDK